jgi:hypothetical protein
MYNDLILLVHKLVAPLQARQQINIMLSHGIVNAIAVTDPIDGVNIAIDVQVAKNQSDLKQEIVILSQLYVINLQQLHDLDRLAMRWNTTDVHSLGQGECESILVEMEMMQKMGTPAPYGGFLLSNQKFKMWLHLKMLINMETPLTNINCPPLLIAMVRQLTCLLF